MNPDTQSSKCDIAASSSSRKTESTTNSSMGKPGIMRQIWSNTGVSVCYNPKACHKNQIFKYLSLTVITF